MCASLVALVVSDSLLTLWTVAHQAPLSTGFSSQEYWSGLPCSPPGDLSHLGIELTSPALWVDSLPLSYQGSPAWEEKLAQIATSTQKRMRMTKESNKADAFQSNLGSITSSSLLFWTN